MFTLLAVGLLILHVFSLFSPFFLFPCFLSLCLPHTMFVYSLSLFLCFFCLFLKKHLYLFGFLFNVFHLFIPFLQNCFCSISFVVSHLFLICFFSIVFFRTREIDPFFLGAEKKLFNPSKNLFFSEILSFHVKKIFHRFSNFLKFLKKNLIFVISYKKPTKWHLQPTMFVPISFSDNLFVFRKYPSLQLFKKMFFIISFLCLLSFESFLEQNLIR